MGIGASFGYWMGLGTWLSRVYTFMAEEGLPQVFLYIVLKNGHKSVLSFIPHPMPGELPLKRAN
jgi:hypothetical protein